LVLGLVLGLVWFAWVFAGIRLMFCLLQALPLCGVTTFIENQLLTMGFGTVLHSAAGKIVTVRESNIFV
jgi:hypothetical protein